MPTRPRRENKGQQISNQAREISMEDVKARVSEIGEGIQSGLNEASREIRTRLRRKGLGEATIPDAFRGVPKLISPRLHRWLDLAVTGYFAVLGTVFAIRGRGGAAAAAFINAGAVGGVAALTDYNGSGGKAISFKLHGTLDAVQAATAALGPALHGFADESKSAFFYGQALNELGVIALTDWDAGMRSPRRRRAA
jgi:hypothetical protein